MMTLILRLCSICAVSSLLEMAVLESALKKNLRMICGMVMLLITIEQAQSVLESLTQQKDIVSILNCLME